MTPNHLMVMTRQAQNVRSAATSAFLYNSPTRNLNTAKSKGRLFSNVGSEGSKRGLEAVKLLPTYLADARACPEGSLQLGVAENQMLEDLLVPALTEFGTNDPAFAADCIYYQPTHGRPQFREAMATYLQRTLKLSKSLDSDGLVMGAGCNAVLENLCFCLAEKGDTVLIPTPYYAAFEFDLVARAGLSVVPVTTFDFNKSVVPPADSLDPIPPEAYYPNRQALDSAYHLAQEQGKPPRILLLSHPNNPLGICYPPEVMKECIDWCRERQVHLVSDEIYAGSVYRSPEVFTSALELASTDSENQHTSNGLGLGSYVHFVYAFSKDFALSGLRVGACYSENEMIRLPMQKLNDLCQISSQTQVLVERMLTAEAPSSPDDDGTAPQYWTDDFLKENHSRIRSRCDALQACLVQGGIPFLPADSGLFAWMDFSRFLAPLDPADVDSDGNESLESKNKRERELYLELINEFGVLFTPGMSMRTERPGFFRCVFTAASDEDFALGLERIQRFAAEKN